MNSWLKEKLKNSCRTYGLIHVLAWTLILCSMALLQLYFLCHDLLQTVFGYLLLWVFVVFGIVFSSRHSYIVEKRMQGKTDELREISRFNRQIIDNVQEGIIVYGLDLRYQVWNAYMENLTGMQGREVLGRHPLAIFPFLGEHGVIDRLEKTLREEASHAMEFPFKVMSTGKTGWVSHVMSPLRDAQGEIVGVISMVHEITKSKEAHKALRLNGLRLESLLKISEYSADSIQELLDFALSEAITLTDSEIGYLYLYDENKQEFTLNTWSKEVMKQCAVLEPQSVYQLENTGFWGEAVRQARPLMDNNFGSPHPAKKGLPSGHLPLHKFLTVPVFSQGHIVAVIGVANKQDDYNETDIRHLNLMMDSVWKIVQRKNAETEQKNLQAQLIHSQKMEAIGTLASGVAHDFNNSLNVILGYGDMLLDKMQADNASKEYMQELLKAAERAVTITKRLLSFSRRQVMEAKAVNVNEIITGVQKMLNRILGADIDLQVNLADKCLLVMADAAQIEQVLINLSTNARDAMPQGGQLVINLETAQIDEAFITAYGYGKSGEYAVITVADTGHGMDAEVQTRIFEPFFTTKKIGEGTGLGLAISYGIVKQHQGYIKCYSEPYKGAAFKLYLPLLDDAAAVCAKAEASDALQGGTETILLAEDDPALLNLGKIVMESFGYHVITADNGEDAIAKFVENQDKIKLVILDLIMPKKNGKEVCEAIQKIMPSVRIFFMSGYPREMINKMDLVEGIEVLCKPVSQKNLLEKIREVLDKK